MTKVFVRNKGMFRVAARQEVVGILREILSDPDSGLSLRSGAIRRLKQSVRLKESGGLKELREVLRHYEK